MKACSLCLGKRMLVFHYKKTGNMKRPQGFDNNDVTAV